MWPEIARKKAGLKKNPNDHPVIKIGVTGGIGSGKSTVCRIFNVLGIPLFSADDEAKRIMNSDKEIIEKVKAIAGRDVYSSGSLDRSELAGIIFNNRGLLQEINNLVHPVVFRNFKLWSESVTGQYVIMESAILFNNPASEFVNKTIAVVAPVEERVERVVRRSNMTDKEVLDRIRNQVDDETMVRLSDFVIYNSEHELIIPSVLKIHEEILSLVNNGV
jgi:dephospho-CoA kinase